MKIPKRLELKLPYSPLSTNKLYSGKKTRSWYYKKFRKEVFRFLSDNGFKEDSVDLSGNLILEMEVGFSSNLSDCSNSVKGIEDILAEFFGFQDRMVVEVHVYKYLVNKGEEYTLLKIKGTKKNIDKRIKYVK